LTSIAISLLLSVSTLLGLPQTTASENQTATHVQTVGKAGYIEDLVLPGSELIAKPLQQESEMVVRIIQSIPHGDAYRYEIQYHGLEPGTYDLRNWLERKDGSSLDSVPSINVTIESLLPPGQIEPNALETGWIPRLGGYRNVMIGVCLLWLTILLALIFGGRKPAAPERPESQPESLADLLKARLDAVQNNEMPATQYAELERMLFAFWRRRMDLESIDTADALRTIHQDPKAGPLMQQLEEWIHNPHSDKAVDLSELLSPLRSIPATEASEV